MNDVNKREMKWKRWKFTKETIKIRAAWKWSGLHIEVLILADFFIGMVDTIFADVAQPDQARIVAINAHNFLKNGGHFVISIKVLVLNFRLSYIYIRKGPLIRLLTPATRFVSPFRVCTTY